MIEENFILSKEYVGNLFTSSYQDKYIVFDNFADKKNPKIKSTPTYNNNKYIQIIVVLQGCMTMYANNKLIKIKSNDFIAITPGVKISIEDSTCLFFSFATLSNLVNDIYDHIGIEHTIKTDCFCYHHYHFNPEQINLILKSYQRMKREHLRPDYYLKEFNLRALFTSYIAYFHSFTNTENIIYNDKTSRQSNLFNTFLDELEKYYKSERSVQFYAQKLSITPKYLSTITIAFTGHSASTVIDEYVAFKIKGMLYSKSETIKEISKQMNFPTQSFFGRYFKRITGVSPREYQMHNNKKLILSNE